MLQYSNFQRLWQSWAIRKLFPTDRKNYFYKAKGEKNQKGVYFEPYFPLSVGARSPAGWWPPSSPWWSHHSSSSSWWPGSRGAPWPSSACSLLPCTYCFSPVSPHSSSSSWWPGSRGAPWPSLACSLLPGTYCFSPVSPHSSSSYGGLGRAELPGLCQPAHSFKVVLF